MTFGPPPPESVDVYISTHRNFYGRGGALVFATGLNRALRGRGISTCFLNQSSPADPPCEEFDDTPQRNVAIAGSGLLWRLKSWLFTRRLEESLRKLPPPRKAFVSMSFYWVAAAKRAWPNTPVYFPVPCLLANCTPFTWPGGRPPSFWKWLDHRGVRRAEHAACAAADVILTPTEQARQEILAFHPRIRGEIRTCPYGPEPIRLSREMRNTQRNALGVEDEAVLFLAVGACEPNKGFDLAIREWQAVDRRGVLAIVGEGPDRAAYKQMVADLKLAGHVLVVGPQPVIDPWLAAADCVLSTSHYDMFPLSVQEGWAAGRPAIVPLHEPPSVFSGCAEIVRIAGGGLLYDRNRSGALARRVNQFINERVLRASLTKEADQIGHTRAGWEQYANAILGTRNKSTANEPQRTAESADPEPCVAATSSQDGMCDR